MGTRQLGYYTVAWTWATYGCTTLYETVHSVLFPRFSQAQQSRADLAMMYYRSLRAVMFIAAMANTALFAVADVFLVTVLGKGNPRWLPSLVPLEILCVYGVLRASIEPVGNAIMALGQSKLILRAVILPVIAEVCLLPLVTLKWGLAGAAWLVTGAYALQWTIYGPFLSRELGVRIGRVFKLAVPIVVAAVSAVLISRTLHLAAPFSWTAVILRSGVACVTFAVAHELLSGGAVLSEIMLVARSKARPASGAVAACTVQPSPTGPGVV
jgi:O-antigen/teichoic acid export membrane protein